MRYRPSYAGFELGTGSALAGVLPASLSAAGIGTLLTALVVAPVSFLDAGLSGLSELVGGVFALGFVAMIVMLVATVFCAFYIGLLGLPIAALMGRRLERPEGLAVALGTAFAGALVATAIFEAWPFGPIESWSFGVLVLAYALPAGVLYRQSVLSARQLSPFAELAPPA